MSLLPPTSPGRACALSLPTAWLFVAILLLLTSQVPTVMSQQVRPSPAEVLQSEAQHVLRIEVLEYQRFAPADTSCDSNYGADAWVKGVNSTLAASNTANTVTVGDIIVICYDERWVANLTIACPDFPGPPIPGEEFGTGWCGYAYLNYNPDGECFFPAAYGSSFVEDPNQEQCLEVIANPVEGPTVAPADEPVDEPQQSCRLCPSGNDPADKPYLFPKDDFSQGQDLGCFGLDALIAEAQQVQGGDCALARESVQEQYYSINMTAYCECDPESTEAPPTPCGELCPEGRTVPTEMHNVVPPEWEGGVLPRDEGWTCLLFETFVQYTTSPYVNECKTYREKGIYCCYIDEEAANTTTTLAPTSTSDISTPAPSPNVASGTTAPTVGTASNGTTTVSPTAATAVTPRPTMATTPQNGTQGPTVVTDPTDTQAPTTESATTISPTTAGIDNGGPNNNATSAPTNGEFIDPTGTIWGVLRDEAPTTLDFRTSLELVNINKLLIDPRKRFTVFAPTDAAIAADQLLAVYSGNINAWNGHFTYMLEHHIIQNKVLAISDLPVDQSIDVPYESLAGDTILLDAAFQQLVEVPDLVATNGVVHVINDVLETHWYSLGILDVLLAGVNLTATARRLRRRMQDQREEFSFFLDFVYETNLPFDTTIKDGFGPNGTTMIAPRDSAFESATFVSSEKIAALPYHIINATVYKEDLDVPSSLLVSTRHAAQLWVTVDRNGVMRYNDVVVQEELFAKNGVIHVTERYLDPPGILDLVHYTANYTRINIRTLSALFGASEWEVLGPDTTKYTLFAPLDDIFNGEDPVVERLLEPQWSPHLMNLLQSLVVPVQYSREDLLGLNVAQGDSQELETLSGINQTINFFGEQLTISNGEFLEPTMRGVDGIIHVVNAVTLPPSFIYRAYGILARDAYTESFIFNADISSRLSDGTITVLAPPVPQDGDRLPEDVFENHLFSGLWFYSDLLNSIGGNITSVNGKAWQVISGEADVVALATELRDSEGQLFTKIVSVLRDSTNILANNGVIHYIEEILYHESDNVDTGNETGCIVCEGGIEPNNILPDGLTCSDWLDVVSQMNLLPFSQECTLERAAGVKYCGCLPPPDSFSCQFCEGANGTNTSIPDARGLTCESLRDFVAVDGNYTCDVIQAKYARFCGCSGSSPQGCSFCEGGGDVTNKAFPYQQDISPEGSVFFDPISDNCQTISDIYSVQTVGQYCDQVDAIFNAEFDIRSWCECPGVPPPDPCGDFCPPGTNVTEDLGGFIPENSPNQNCSELEHVHQFISASQEPICAIFSNISTACCEQPPTTATPAPNNASTPAPVTDLPNTTAPSSPPTRAPTAAPEIVEINLTFVVSNQEGLTSADLATRRQGAIFNQAVEEFVTELVADVEGERKRQRKLLLRSNIQDSRKLTVALEPDSPEVWAVFDTECRISSIPAGSLCQYVYGRYNLTVVNDNRTRDEVTQQYIEETNKALDEGKLQASLDEVDPDSPYTIAGSAVSNQPREGTEDDGEMALWLLIVIIVVSILGCCCILGAIAYFVLRKKPEEEETSVKLLEEEVQEVAPDTDSQEGEEEDDDNDEFRQESEFWREPEVEIEEMAGPRTVVEETDDEADDDWDDENAKEYWEVTAADKDWVGDDMTAQFEESIMAAEEDVQDTKTSDDSLLLIEDEHAQRADPDGDKDDPDAERERRQLEQSGSVNNDLLKDSDNHENGMSNEDVFEESDDNSDGGGEEWEDESSDAEGNKAKAVNNKDEVEDGGDDDDDDDGDGLMSV